MSYFRRQTALFVRGRSLFEPKAASCLWRLKAHANPATGMLVLKYHRRLLIRGLDAHQEVKRSAQQATGRLFALFWPLRIAQPHTHLFIILVDEIDPLLHLTATERITLHKPNPDPAVGIIVLSRKVDLRDIA